MNYFNALSYRKLPTSDNAFFALQRFTLHILASRCVDQRIQVDDQRCFNID